MDGSAAVSAIVSSGAGESTNMRGRNNLFGCGRFGSWHCSTRWKRTIGGLVQGIPMSHPAH
jgi:hypothetical protein